jgi:hypothetical protein
MDWVPICTDSLPWFLGVLNVYCRIPSAGPVPPHSSTRIESNQILPLHGTLWGTTPVAKGTLFLECTTCILNRTFDAYTSGTPICVRTQANWTVMQAMKPSKYHLLQFSLLCLNLDSSTPVPFKKAWMKLHTTSTIHFTRACWHQIHHHFVY